MGVAIAQEMELDTHGSNPGLGTYENLFPLSVRWKNNDELRK